jgi:hypothetical protein
MNYQINIGCGKTPTKGWKNYDNSPAIKLASSPLKYFIAKSLGLLNSDQIDNIEWLKKNNIEFVDATKKIPLPDKSFLQKYEVKNGNYFGDPLDVDLEIFSQLYQNIFSCAEYKK